MTRFPPSGFSLIPPGTNPAGQVKVDLAGNTLRLDVGETKNDDGREVTLSATSSALLEECVRGKDPDDYVFTRNGKPVRDFRAAWAKLCIAAGVGRMICRVCEKIGTGEKCKCGGKLKYTGLIVHDLRRSAARSLRNAGVPEGVIMQIGGWRTRSVFDRYSIVVQSDIRDAIGKLEKQRLENLKGNYSLVNSRKSQLSHNSGISDPLEVEAGTLSSNEYNDIDSRPDGETGRRTGLKIPGP